MIPSRMHDQSRGEEIANSVTHLVGFCLSIAAVVFLAVYASLRGTAWHIVSCSIFGATLIILYMGSTLYHGLRPGPAKRVFRVIDHSSIFFLIAGTYTPFMLVSLRGPWGYSIFGVNWTLAIAGVVLKSVTTRPWPIVSTMLYLAMGWLIVIAIKPLLLVLPWAGFLWLGAGGLFYTAGIVFYGFDRVPFFHMIWHLFVLAGSICHFFAVFLYVIPPR